MQMRFIYVDKAQKRPQESYEISVGVIACLKVLMDFFKINPFNPQDLFLRFSRSHFGSFIIVTIFFIRVLHVYHCLHIVLPYCVINEQFSS